MTPGRLPFLCCLCFLFSLTPATATRPPSNYQTYHQLIGRAEVHMVRQEFDQALALYQQVFDRYEFVFRRDYQVATQLAWKLGHTNEAFLLLSKGIASGWTWKSIRKTKFLNSLRQHERWGLIRTQYDSLRNVYQNRLDTDTRAMVQTMFRQDQWKALGALFRFGETARNRYVLRRFTPQSERHFAVLKQIIRTKGYPGEQLIGNNYWAETILSHHNSMTVDYTQRDTLYPQLKPLLLRAVEAGQMAPFEFAMIDNWYTVIRSDHHESSYGYLDALTSTNLPRTDSLRTAIGLRSVDIRNKLIDVQQQTGMNFYLPQRPQPNGKITVLKN